jgi:hypothetical protein
MTRVQPRSMVAGRTRLTPEQVRDRALTELDLQRLVTDLAGILGWEWVHFRPAQTQRGWRTPVSGPLGQGWPDLVLVRIGHSGWVRVGYDRRLIFAELKREGGQLTADQERVLDVLRSLVRDLCEEGASTQVEVHVWRPSDLTSGAIEEVLR